MAILERIRELQRGREILKILRRHGFGDLLSQLGFSHLLRIPFLYGPSFSSLPLGKRLRHLFEDLGPTYIKFGQILSTRLDLFPPEVIEDLSELQDQVLYVDYSKIERELVQEFGSIDKVFRHIDPNPLAAASIAQVHRATLQTGEEVVVKVRRPNIEETSAQDLSILEKMATLASQRTSFFQGYNIKGIFQEFARSLQGELDLLMEARNMMRFSQNLAVYPWIRLPKVFLDHSTRRVLVMEHLDGTKVTEYKGPPRRQKLLAQRGARAIFHQVFIDGLFHGDPHPGNIFIQKDGNIAFVDFGMIGRLDARMKDNIFTLMRGVLARDSERLSEAILKICRYEGKEISIPHFQRDLIDILDSFYGLPVRYIHFDQVISQLFATARRYKLYIPAEYTMITKALLTIEKIAYSLDPDFNLMDSMKSFMEDEVFSVKAQQGIEKLKKTLSYMAETMETLPSQMKGVLQKLDQGKLSIEFKHQGLEILDRQLERASRKITAGLILTALIIGSALIITSPHRGDHTIWGYDALGLLGFFVASAIGLAMVLSAYRD